MSSEAHVAGLREQIEQGRYTVDAQAVADAIIQRWLTQLTGRSSKV